MLCLKRAHGWWEGFSVGGGGGGAAGCGMARVFGSKRSLEGGAWRGGFSDGWGMVWEGTGNGGWN